MMTQRSVKKFLSLAILLAILLSIVPMASAGVFGRLPSRGVGGAGDLPAPVDLVPAEPPTVDDASFEFWMTLKPFLFGVFF